MVDSIAKITLDLQQASSPVTVSVKLGDIGRKIVIVLSDGGFPYEITEDCYAVLTATKPDGNILYNRCDIVDNAIIYSVTAQTTAAAGRLPAEVKLYGAEDKLITSATFRLLVHETVCQDEQIESTGEASALTHLVSQTLEIEQRSGELIAAAETAVQVVEQAAEYIEAAVQNANEAAHRADQFLPAAQAAEQKAEEAIRNVNALREVVSKFHSNIVEEASGEVITISDSAEAPFQGLKVFGRTEQFTTTGKNLIQNTAKTATQNGVTFTVNDDGSVTMNGTALDTVSAFCTINNSMLQLTEGVRYTLSGCPKHTGVAMFAGQYGNDSGSGYTFTAYTTASSGLSPQIYIRVSRGTTVNNVVVKPMLRLASVTDATYEPYTGGIPAPNPDYPQTLDSVGADGSVAVKVCGKNLFAEGTVYLGTLETSVARLALDYPTASPVTRSAWHGVGIRVPVMPGTTYTASSDVSPCNYFMAAFYKSMEDVTAGSRAISYIEKQNTNVVTFTTPDECNCVVVLTTSKTETEYSWTWWQVEHGSVAAAYEPYKNGGSLTISTPNGLPGIPVTSGGNYTDGSGQQWICDEVDFEKGVYVQRVEKRVFTGTEAFRLHASGRYYLDIANGRFAITDTWGLFSNDVSREGGTQFGSSGVYFKTAHSTVDEFKAYLADNYASGQPITAQIVLRTFTETALSAEQLAAFAELHTNYPSTTVFNEEGAGMEVKYVADTKLYIDKKFAELATALVNNV